MKALTGNENFWFDGMPLGFLLCDFWAWSSSDLLKGTLRGALAEFIVATAIGVDTSEAHEDLYPYDLTMPCSGMDDCKIEVKSSAYVNSGAHVGPSEISFRCGRSRRTERGKEVLPAEEARRASDVYVFCLQFCRDRAEVDPLNLDQWLFYVLPTATFEDKCPNRKTISLPGLHKLRAALVDYGNLRPAIEAAYMASKQAGEAAQ